jgi:hypothetical protein
LLKLTFSRMVFTYSIIAKRVLGLLTVFKFKYGGNYTYVALFRLFKK